MTYEERQKLAEQQRELEFWRTKVRFASDADDLRRYSERMKFEQRKLARMVVEMNHEDERC